MTDPGAGARLLVVDDEPFILDAVAASLRFLGFEVDTAATGRGGLRRAREGQPDLIVLDVLLPDLDGFAVVRSLRREGSTVPVIFLTAKDTQQDAVTGLGLGGDDYVTKPFGLAELAARVRAVLRRTQRHADAATLRFADVELNQDTYQVRRAGRPVALSRTEFRLLRYLLLNQRRVLTREQLLRHVWDYDFDASSTVVGTYISYLRRKLCAFGPDLIHTERGVGFGLRQPKQP